MMYTGECKFQTAALGFFLFRTADDVYRGMQVPDCSSVVVVFTVPQMMYAVECQSRLALELGRAWLASVPGSAEGRCTNPHSA